MAYEIKVEPIAILIMTLFMIIILAFFDEYMLVMELSQTAINQSGSIGTGMM